MKDTATTKTKHRTNPSAVKGREKLVREEGVFFAISPSPRRAPLDAYKKASPGFPVPRAARLSSLDSTNHIPASKGETS